MFEDVPVGSRGKQSNRDWYLKCLGMQLKIKTSEKWEEVTDEQLRANHGSGLIAKLTVKEIRAEGADRVTR